MSPPTKLTRPIPTQHYSSLLSDHDFAYENEDPVVSAPRQQRHRRAKSSPLARELGESGVLCIAPLVEHSRESGELDEERPPARKLVKDPNGSSRPSMSIELSDSDGEKRKGS